MSEKRWLTTVKIACRPHPHEQTFSAHMGRSHRMNHGMILISRCLCKRGMSVLLLWVIYTMLAAYPIPNESADTVARVLVDRVFSTFAVRGTLNREQGKEFENRVI